MVKSIFCSGLLLILALPALLFAEINLDGPDQATPGETCLFTLKGLDKPDPKLINWAVYPEGSQLVQLFDAQGNPVVILKFTSDCALICDVNVTGNFALLIHPVKIAAPKTSGESSPKLLDAKPPIPKLENDSREDVAEPVLASASKTSLQSYVVFVTQSESEAMSQKIKAYAERQGIKTETIVKDDYTKPRKVCDKDKGVCQWLQPEPPSKRVAAFLRDAEGQKLPYAFYYTDEKRYWQGSINKMPSDNFLTILETAKETSK